MIKLSEAIRLGSLLIPATKGRFYTGDPKSIKAACPAMTAMIAVDSDLLNNVNKFSWPSFFLRCWPWVLTSTIKCPLCNSTEWPSYAGLPHMSDDHNLSREQCADFIASIEPTEELTDEGVTQHAETSTCLVI